MRGPQDRVRPVDDDARDLRARWMPRRRNRDRYDRTRLVDQAVPFGRCFVAQHCPGTRAEQSRPEHRFPGRIAGESGIYATMQVLPAATAHSAAHGVERQAGSRALAAGNSTGLVSQLRRRWFGGHELIVTAGRCADLSAPEPVDNSARGCLLVDNELRLPG